MTGVCLLTLAGCSDGTSDLVTSDGPFASGSGITRVGTPTVGGGETFLFHTEIIFSTALDTANPPTVDILNAAGTSLTGGKQKLQQVLAPSGTPNADPNGWTYQFTLAPSAIVSAVSTIVYAQDTDAKKGNTPFTTANVKLP